jgi:hypothetical protein
MIEFLQNFVTHQHTFVMTIASASVIIPLSRFFSSMSAYKVLEKVNKQMEEHKRGEKK